MDVEVAFALAVCFLLGLVFGLWLRAKVGA